MRCTDVDKNEACAYLLYFSHHSSIFFLNVRAKVAGSGSFCNSLFAIWTWESSQFYWPFKPADALAGIFCNPSCQSCSSPSSAGSSFISHIFIYLWEPSCVSLQTPGIIVWCLGNFPLPKWSSLQRGMVLSFIRAAIQPKCVSSDYCCYCLWPGKLMVKALSATADMHNRGRSFCKVTAPTCQEILRAVFLD